MMASSPGDLALRQTRYADSTVSPDIIFYGSALCCVWMVHPQVIHEHGIAFASLITLELVGDTIGLLKFRHWPAVHSYLAKLWGICLFAVLCQVLWKGSAGLTLCLLISLGFVMYTDWIAILVLSNTNAVDVPSAWQALKRRRRPILSDFVNSGENPTSYPNLTIF